MVNGVQLSAPFGRYSMAIEVAEAIGSTRLRRLSSLATDLIEIDPDQPLPEAIERAAACIRRGDVVAIPTDALYMLVADPLNLNAVGQVFAAKGREIHRSLPLLISGPFMAEELASELSARFHLLARHFWPGPLTVIVTGLAPRCRSK